MLIAAALTTVLVAAAAVPAQAGTRKQMVRAINYVRSWHHRRQLMLSGALSAGAEAWARSLMRSQVLVHASLHSGEGEIIEWHTGSRARVNRTVIEWWHSTEHRRVMMAREFHRVGVGRAVGTYGGRRCTIWVVRFS